MWLLGLEATTHKIQLENCCTQRSCVLQLWMHRQIFTFAWSNEQTCLYFVPGFGVYLVHGGCAATRDACRHNAQDPRCNTLQALQNRHRQLPLEGHRLYSHRLLCETRASFQNDLSRPVPVRFGKHSDRKLPQRNMHISTLFVVHVLHEEREQTRLSDRPSENASPILFSCWPSKVEPMGNQNIFHFAKRPVGVRSSHLFSPAKKILGQKKIFFVISKITSDEKRITNTALAAEMTVRNQ